MPYRPYNSDDSDALPYIVQSDVRIAAQPRTNAGSDMPFFNAQSDFSDPDRRDPLEILLEIQNTAPEESARPEILGLRQGPFYPTNESTSFRMPYHGSPGFPTLEEQALATNDGTKQANQVSRSRGTIPDLSLVHHTSQVYDLTPVPRAADANAGHLQEKPYLCSGLFGETGPSYGSSQSFQRAGNRHVVKLTAKTFGSPQPNTEDASGRCLTGKEDAVQPCQKDLYTVWDVGTGKTVHDTPKKAKLTMQQRKSSKEIRDRGGSCSDCHRAHRKCRLTHPGPYAISRTRSFSNGGKAPHRRTSGTRECSGASPQSPVEIAGGLASPRVENTFKQAASSCPDFFASGECSPGNGHPLFGYPFLPATGEQHHLDQGPLQFPGTTCMDPDLCDLMPDQRFEGATSTEYSSEAQWSSGTTLPTNSAELSPMINATSHEIAFSNAISAWDQSFDITDSEPGYNSGTRLEYTPIDLNGDIIGIGEQFVGDDREGRVESVQLES